MYARYVISSVVTCLLGSMAFANTLSFDDVPSGSFLQCSLYIHGHRTFFSSDFMATDHTGWPWGTPRSGRNVLTSLGKPSPNVNPYVVFGDAIVEDPVLSVSAFFSTQTSAMVRVTAYRRGTYDYVPADSQVIGAIGESWDNRLVVLNTTPDLPFELIRFEGVNSDNDLLGFCADDMTITLVPEPSSLLALAGGLGGIGLLRRRVNGKK